MARPSQDTTRAVLVWEPKRVTPQYAVPAADLQADLADAPRDDDAREVRVVISAGGPPVVDPRSSFGFHTVDGQPLTVRTSRGDRIGAGYRLTDPDLDGLVVLDFDAFDWLEEEEPLVAHPRDPFHRIDVRRSTRRVRVQLAGVVLAESERPSLLFETMLPERLLPPSRGRSIRPAHPDRYGDLLRLQGNGTLLVLCAGGRGRRRYLLAVSRAARRRRQDPRDGGVLQRARRPDRRRRAPGAAGLSLVTPTLVRPPSPALSVASRALV
jgi:hypothetical protein